MTPRDRLESWILAVSREALAADPVAAFEVIRALTGGQEAFCPQPHPAERLRRAAAEFLKIVKRAVERANHPSIGAYVCLGESLAASLPERLGQVEVPLLSSAERRAHVGVHAGWDQRRAFDLGLLRGVARRSGDLSIAESCAAGIDRVEARRAAGTLDDAL